MISKAVETGSSKVQFVEYLWANPGDKPRPALRMLKRGRQHQESYPGAGWVWVFRTPGCRLFSGRGTEPAP